MTLREKIKYDYGTLRRFCRVENLHYQSLCNALCGRADYKTIVNKLIELGYIQSSSELK